MNQNSLLAYVDILESLPSRQMQVYKCIEEHEPISNKQISKTLFLAINCITGRVKELRDQGVVIKYDDTIDSNTKKKVSRWRVKHKLR